MIVVLVVVMAVGLGASVAASRGVVRVGIVLSQRFRFPPFVLGTVILGVGTDLPEVANSVAACLAGHGDLNVGDSIGSSVTQATLVLGLLPLVVGTFPIRHREIRRVGSLTVAALVLGTALLADGHVSRLDGVVLVVVWLAAVAILWERDAPPVEPVEPEGRRTGTLVAQLAMLLMVVGAGATIAVAAFIRIADSLDIPEYVLSFFLASFGTSLPELIVAITAARRGQRELAIGDLVGATLSDATLSLGMGPIVAPVAVSTGLVLRGSIGAAVAIALVTTLLVRRRRHDRASAGLLLGIYAAFYIVLAPW